jgi:hypothetical protein
MLKTVHEKKIPNAKASKYIYIVIQREARKKKKRTEIGI